VSPHSHSFRSLTLLGPPIGWINIPSNYDGFNLGEVKVNVKQIIEVSKKGKIYEIQLEKSSDRFTFRKYEDLCQLGRFYSLTVNQTTRLYTTVNFLSVKNRKFMQGFFGERIGKEEIVYQNDAYVPPASEPSNSEENSILTGDDYVPLLMKIYPGGELT
jgi:hypothetical protein